MTTQPLTLGSLFDGSGGFPLGGLLARITPVWASEIEPFPIRVTTKRLPNMKHYGDITAMDGSVIEPVDIITFGSPCTDLSVAGRRAGLGGKQSCLFYEAIRIIKEMRSTTNGRYPRWICWENVPGAFSSHAGRDFQAVLEAVIGIVQPGTTVPAPEKNRWPTADAYVGTGWAVAYRTLDAQHWGLPQRRKRVFLVASLTDESAWKILFKSEGLSGYSAACFRAWQAATQDSSACLGAAGVDGHHGRLTGDVTLALNVTSGSTSGRNSIILNDQGGSVIDISENVTATLRAQDHGHPPCVIERSSPAKLIPFRKSTRPHNKKEAPTWQAAEIANTLNTFDVGESRCNELAVSTFGICANGSEGMKSGNPQVGFYQASIARTLDGNGGNPGCHQGGIAVVETIPFAQNQRNELRLLGDKSGALAAESGMKQQTYVLQGSMIGRKDGNGPQGSGINEDVRFMPDTIDRHAVVYGIGRNAFNQGVGGTFGLSISENISPPMVAQSPGAVAWDGSEVSPTITASNADGTQAMPDKGNCNSIIEPNYAVRRLTPTECARLQGFPDWWCSDLATPEPTEEDIACWSEVFETRRKAMGKSSKSKSKNQIIKWLRCPHSDAAEYKMWGNGVALPCVFFVLAGIAYYAKNAPNHYSNAA